MLALKSKLTLTFLLVGTIILTGSAFGQQTPSQRYQPVRTSDLQNLAVQQRFQQARPNMHVPPQQMQKLTPALGAANSQKQNSYSGVRHQFGDTPASSRANTPIHRGHIQQTSYQSDANQNGEPVVPAILTGGLPTVPSKPVQTRPETLPQPPLSAPQFQPPKSYAPVVDESTGNSIQKYEAAMSQTRARGPRIAPSELATQQDGLNEQMAELRRRAEAKAKAEADKLAAELAAEQQEIERLANEQEEANRIAAERLAAAKLQAEQMAAEQAAAEQAAAELAQKQEAQRLEAERLETERQQAQQLAAAREEAERLAAMEAAKEVSANDFIGQITGQSNASTKTHGAYSAQRLVAKENTGERLASMPTAIQMTSDRQSLASQFVRDSQVRPVSSQQDAPAATLKLSAPAIQVETYGPETVGVNKPANYQVIVRNTSNSNAERILVGINMPTWVDIANVNLTSGGKEVTDGQNQARLVWSIDQIPANGSQTITITAVPRKAEMFDVGVEWTLVPRVGKTNITVTEPRLEMSISGPKEVLFGESAMYHVTLRNPGTGTAEKVFVMLPEALGGERQALDPIPAGQDISFQVELLARTAGDLNLSATAVADGGLKVSADRSLTVRRANLEVGLEGPGLKYSGSPAQYTVTIKNSGDATAHELVTAVALPTGVKYLGGVDSVKLIEGGIRWGVGSLDPGQTRTFKINCLLNTSGDLQLEVGARGKGDLAASSACLTTVETVADLVLTVADPKGPLPTGEQVPYEIKVINRGTKSAQGVNLVMQFSEGIEPTKAEGLQHRIVSGQGQVLFSPIPKIDPGQEMRFKITAEASKSGTHIFRAQLTCQDSDAREIAEGTTRFFGETIESSTSAPAVNTTPTTDTTTANSSGFGSNDFNGFKR